MINLLDRPIWAALTTRQSDLAHGGGRALCYDPAFTPFAATPDEFDASVAALAALLPQDEPAILIQATCGPLGPGIEIVSEMAGVQMVAAATPPPPDKLDAIRLGDSDAAEMRALAELTKPGPFRARANQLGQFWGVLDEGRLVAMAGERMKMPGFAELSGVCTHPDARGRGLARALSQLVSANIAARGETPILHAYADNRPAIALYESLGFTIRSEMRVLAVLGRG